MAVTNWAVEPQEKSLVSNCYLRGCSDSSSVEGLHSSLQNSSSIMREVLRGVSTTDVVKQRSERAGKSAGS